MGSDCRHPLLRNRDELTQRLGQKLVVDKRKLRRSYSLDGWRGAGGNLNLRAYGATRNWVTHASFAHSACGYVWGEQLRRSTAPSC
jgi:hypothetical protein